MKNDLIEIQDTWISEANRFVVFFDIMGFKDLVMRKPHEYVKEKLKQMLYMNKKGLEDIIGKGLAPKTDSKSKSIFPRIRTVSFSDSVLLISQDDSFEDFISILYAAEVSQTSAIQRLLPTKGAISYGKFTADFENSIFLGQPLIDAYLLQDELFYYGIIVDNNVESYIIDLTKSDQSKISKINEFLLKTKTPLKRGKVIHYNVRLNECRDDHFQNLYKGVSGFTRLYVDNTVNMYYEMIK